MKKILLTLLLATSITAKAQVKIGDNPTTIGNSSLLELESTVKALLITRVANTAAITTPVNGMIIFDVSSNCFKGFQNGAWSGCGFTPPAINSINCTPAFSPAIASSNIAYSGTSTATYTGGNGLAYSTATYPSTGVTGLTLTLTAGTLANGSGTLSFTCTGTPASSGTASFAISFGGQTCTKTITVTESFVIPSTIILGQSKMYMIASVFDQDYLPYTAPTGAATTTTPSAANGINEATTINLQGAITVAGVSVKIPVTCTGSGTLPTYSTSITIPANMTEDGISRDVTLSWAAQAYTSTTTTITATIAAVGGTLNAKKLDIQTGIGNDGLGVLMGSFTFPYNNAGNTTTFQVRDIAGVPDKMMGVVDNSGSTSTHLMLYSPITSEDGNIWLNNNLGAHYSNVNHASFNISSQATSATDHFAYGSLFQWGRKPDGHELITWTSSTSGTSVYGTTTTLSNEPTNALFINTTAYPFNWRTTNDDTLWATVTSANNPCPNGFRVPTNTELTNLVTAASISNSSTAASSLLKLTSAGFRNNGPISFAGNIGFYYSSTTADMANVDYRLFDPTDTVTNSSIPSVGSTVRCIKN